ncbi:MAG: hypothetical protein ABIA04_12375 [Pseudomonadota bacterium]
MSKLSYFILAFFFTIKFFLYAEEEIQVESQQEPGFFDGIDFDGNVSFSGEYDDNVYKTLGENVDADFGSRLYLDANCKVKIDEKEYFNVRYQGGGKKYLNEVSQDSIINNVELGYSNIFKGNYLLSATASVKNKFERRVGDEDYLLSYFDLLSGKYFNDLNLYAFINGKYTFFYYDYKMAYSFHRGRYGAGAKKGIFDDKLAYELNYYFQHQGFLEALSGYSKREDALHEVGNYLHLDTFVFSKLGYVYQFNDSNIDSLKFHNHRFTVEVNKLLPFDIMIMIYGTLLYKIYNSGSIIDEESERSLLTSSEDEFFNSFIIKISKRLYKELHLDFKYSRFSDELSSLDEQYERNVYNIGFRYNF